MRFLNMVVLVTGAASGIGKEIAGAYAEEGAKVMLVDINREGGDTTTNEIQKKGGNASFYEADVGNPRDILAAVKETYEKYCKIDILINNAGIFKSKSPFELTLEEWDDVINTNLRGSFLFAREVARYMRRNESGGSIVNIASTRALMSERNTEAYAASKGGIVALTHALAMSLGDDGIRVNAISPGWIQTENYDALSDGDHKQHPAQRVGKPEDVVKACFYLTDPGNDFVTGINLVVDGGMTRKMIYEE